ncbi:MAG: hypothetical protein KDD55_00915 [Bdellovibrionales bacterium]|nr:hypothetical protein [Bdellovibrionales bacterium]
MEHHCTKIMSFNASEAWRQIPPEEKLDLMAESHARGVAVASSFILICGTLAVGFQFAPLFWTALLAAPIIFQFSASMKWRAVRPLLILQYLAARSAARRYAYNANSADMGLQLIFRGQMEYIEDEENPLALLDAAISNNKSTEVWITLFNDAVIVLSEGKQGAELEFGHVITDKLSVRPADPDQEDYSNNREIILEYKDREYGDYAIKLRSNQPAALTVFEKQLDHLIRIPRLERIESAED